MESPACRPGQALAIVSFELVLERRGLRWNDPLAAMNGIEMPIEWQLQVNLTTEFVGFHSP